MHSRGLLVEGVDPPPLRQLLAGDGIMQWSESEQQLHLNVWNLRAALVAVDANSSSSSSCSNAVTATSTSEDDSVNNVQSSRSSSSINSNINSNSNALSDDATSAMAASAKSADGLLPSHPTQQTLDPAAAAAADTSAASARHQQLQEPTHPCPVRTWAEAAAKGGLAATANSSSNSASSTPTAAAAASVAACNMKIALAVPRITTTGPTTQFAPAASPRAMAQVQPVAGCTAAAAHATTTLSPAQVTAVTQATRLGHAWGGIHWAYPAISRDNFSKRALAKAILSRYPQTHTFEMEGGEAGEGLWLS